MSQATAVAGVSARPDQSRRTSPTSVPRQRGQRPPAPRLRVVAPAPRRSFTGLALLSVVLLGVGLLALLLLNISIGKGAYALTELQSRQRALTVQQQALSQQVEDLGAPQNLAAQAKKLGMVPAPNAAFLTVPGGRVDGDPAVALAPPKPVKKKAATTSTTSKPAEKNAKGAKSTSAKKSTSTKKSTSIKKPATKKPATNKPDTSQQTGTSTGKKKTTSNQADTAR